MYSESVAGQYAMYIRPSQLLSRLSSKAKYNIQRILIFLSSNKQTLMLSSLDHDCYPVYALFKHLLEVQPLISVHHDTTDHFTKRSKNYFNIYMFN